MEIVISIPKLILVQLSKQQTNAIINLRAQSRYDHFIKQIADCEEVWGLYNDGWAVAADNSGTEVLPVWPANEYARICTTHDWEAYEPMSIALDEFIHELLPCLARDGLLIAVSYLPKDEGIVVGSDRLITDIKKELENY